MITVCAMLSALGVVVLYLGSFIEVLDASMSVIASLMTVIVVIEFGRSASWSIYAVTAVLSLLLLPNKSPAVMYAAFFGFYPNFTLFHLFFRTRTIFILIFYNKERIKNLCLFLILFLPFGARAS